MVALDTNGTPLPVGTIAVLMHGEVLEETTSPNRVLLRLPDGHTLLCDGAQLVVDPNGELICLRERASPPPAPPVGESCLYIQRISGKMRLFCMHEDGVGISITEMA